MRISLIIDGLDRSFETDGGLVSGILRECRIPFIFPCGGAGLCGKCKARVSTDGGDVFREQLLCKTYASDGMIVELPSQKEEDAVAAPKDKGSTRKKNESDVGLAGVAVDLGTTNLDIAIVSKKGDILCKEHIPNPQRIYGADVMSRISSAAGDPGDAKRMKELVGESIDAAIKHLLDEYGVTGKERADLKVAIAGNTAMTKLLLGEDVRCLGSAPFDAGDISFKEYTVADMDAFILPGISAFVGGDIVSGMYALDMLEDEYDEYAGQIRLLLDLGTNGEMVLSDGEHTISCAAAAGSAFESTEGITGSELIKIISRLKKLGGIDPAGAFTREEDREKGFPAGRVIPGSRNILTQDDIRAFLLAKAAIRTGITVLCREWEKHFGEPPVISKAYIAGAFGSALDMDAAADVGLIPGDIKEVFSYEGNTSLRGAAAFLVSENGLYPGRCMLRDRRPDKDNISINLAMEEGFEKLFVENISLD